MIYKYDIYESISYLVDRKEQDRTRGKSREKIGKNMIKLVKLFKRFVIYKFV